MALGTSMGDAYIDVHANTGPFRRELPAVHDGPRRLVEPDDLVAWMQRRTHRSPTPPQRSRS